MNEEQINKASEEITETLGWGKFESCSEHSAIKSAYIAGALSMLPEIKELESTLKVTLDSLINTDQAKKVLELESKNRVMKEALENIAEILWDKPTREDAAAAYQSASETLNKINK